MSRVFRNCRTHGQLLQERVLNTTRSSGSQGQDPWALRPMRLYWHSNSGGQQTDIWRNTRCGHRAIQGNCERKAKAKTAASRNGGDWGGESRPKSRPSQASSQKPPLLPASTCRLEARTGTYPPAFPESGPAMS